jgi:hypothetical protein
LAAVKNFDERLAMAHSARAFEPEPTAISGNAIIRRNRVLSPGHDADNGLTPR